MRKATIFGAVVSIFAIIGVACSSAVDNGPAPTSQPTAIEGVKGEAVFAVSDAAADMGAVSEVTVTINGVRVRSDAGTWTTVSTETKAFGLLELEASGAMELLAKAELAADTYDQIELNISKVVVTDASGEHEAKMPNATMVLEGKMDVVADASSSAEFDFQTDQSLHVT